MASYDSILETTAIRVIVDDAAVQSKLAKVRQTAKRSADETAKAQQSSTRATAQAERATESLSDAIKTNARLALTLRREYENDIITTDQFKKQADQLRKTLLNQASQVSRTTKEYDRAQLGANRLSTALRTVDGRASKLGFSANVTTGVMGALNRRLVAAGPAGQSAAAGIAQFTTATRVAQGAASRLYRFMSAQFIPIFATFAGIAGIGLATRGLGNFVNASFEAEIRLRLFSREIEKAGGSIDAGSDSLQRLAQRFRSTEDVVAQGAVQLLRYGATIEQTERLLEAGGASALAFGRTASQGFEAVAQAIVGEQSQILNRIGIAGNLSTAYRRYASDLGTTTEALTRQQKVQAALNLILEETGGEIEALDEILGGFGGALTALQAEQRRTSIALGDEFRDEIAQIIDAASDFLRVFREQIVPFLGDTLGPAFETAAENLTALSDSLRGVQDPATRAGEAVTGFLTPLATLIAYVDIARGSIDQLGGRLNQFGETVFGPAEGFLDRFGNRFVPEKLQDRLGFEEPSRGGGGGRGGSTPRELAAQRVAAGADLVASGRELLNVIRSGDPNAIAAAIFGEYTPPAAAPPPPPASPGSTAGSGGGAGGSGAGSDFNLLRGTSEGFTRAEAEIRRLVADVLTTGFQDARADLATSQAGVNRLSAVGRGVATRQRGAADAAAQTQLESNAFDAGGRIIRALAAATARGIEQESQRIATSAEAARGDLSRFGIRLEGLAGAGRSQAQENATRLREAEAASAREAATALGQAGSALDNLARAGRSALTSLPTDQERASIVLGELANVSRSAGGYGTGADLRGRDVNFTPRPFEGTPFTDTGAEGVAPAFNPEVFARQFKSAGEDFAAEARQASIDFAGSVIDAGSSFVGTIESFRRGDIGGGIAGLGQTAGGILGGFGLGGIGALVGAGAGLLGGLFGLFSGGGGDSPAANSAQNRRNLSTLEVNFTFNQQNDLGLLNDPNTQRALDDAADSAFRRFEELVRRNLEPRIRSLETREGLA